MNEAQAGVVSAGLHRLAGVGKGESSSKYWAEAAEVFRGPTAAGARLKAYDSWLDKALTCDGTQFIACAQFLAKAREYLGLTLVDAARATQRVWESGKPRLSDDGRRVGLALCAVLLHADGAMQTLEVAAFKMAREMLGLGLQDLAFLKTYVGEKAEDLGRRLGKDETAMLLPHMLRMVAADGVLRPNELNALRAALDGANVGSTQRDAAGLLVGLELGIALDL